MTDLLDEQHARIALDLLEANTVLDGKVFDGVVSNPWPARPYVLVYTDIHWLPGDEGAANAIDHASVTCRVTWRIHCVGDTAPAARAMTMQARSSLLNAAPLTVPTGRSCTRLQEDDAIPPQRDESTGEAVMDAVLTYSTISVPG